MGVSTDKCLDEATLLEWFTSALAIVGTDAGVKLARTREGYVAKMGVHKSSACTTLTEAMVQLRTSIRGDMTVGR